MSDSPALPPDLHYVDDSQPGIARKNVRDRFCYIDAQGLRIRDPLQIARIEALAVPPAYTQVWICSDPKGICRPPAAMPGGRSPALAGGARRRQIRALAAQAAQHPRRVPQRLYPP